MKKIRNFYEHNGWLLGNANLGGPVQIAFKKNGDGRVRKHFHIKAHEYFIVLNGTAVITINEEDIALKKGVIVVVEPGEMHVLKERSDDFEVLLLMDKYYEDDTSAV